MPRVWDVPVHDSTRVRDARVAAEHAAALAGLDEQRTSTAALVATELATNLLKHAGGGQVLIDVVPPPILPADREAAPCVQVAAVDHGPGIPDVSAALRDGFTTKNSLGAGLGTCARLADDFDLHTVPGRGTVVVARIGPVPEAAVTGSGPAGRVRAGAVNVPFGGAEYSGDAWAWVRHGDLVTLMLADGLGHGPDAARASTAAVEALRASPHLPPAEAMRQLDRALSGTRGAAVAVAQIDTRAGLLRFTGVGNIGARLCEGGTWRHLVSRPGIVGTHRPTTLREEERPWADDRVLVLHSDGLPSRWSPTSDTCRTATDPAVTAAVTIRDASSPARPVRDDTAVAVLAPTPPDGP
ncbi:anti-sigma regulatory factor (Ser/Thr protein kinase) [Streptomyces sp. BK208]|uniref:ATP-binding SpoIIE family protein phosphatase n=1 Tax=Streptomyces sp. BK208 TaxID=2512150 RepID=UPI00105C38D7|nr:ATP-binding SpoIIE family protein phosphatase [Streptomyces sp. BK208]TDT38774.1 anti-sigma regulatory factor (Ser/Thr protein kinase) [Streptomyces sp. BK208]